jgi:hypothetical protein
LHRDRSHWTHSLVTSTLWRFLFGVWSCPCSENFFSVWILQTFAVGELGLRDARMSSEAFWSAGSHIYESFN